MPGEIETMAIVKRKLNVAPAKPKQAWFVVDDRGNVFPDSCETSADAAIQRFCYPSLRWEAFKGSGYRVERLWIVSK